MYIICLIVLQIINCISYKLYKYQQVSNVTRSLKTENPRDKMKELSISKLPNESHRFATIFQENPQFDQLKAKWIYRGSKSVYSSANLKKRLHRLAEIAYYQAGKIVVQTFLPLHPPVALITIDYSGITASTRADTHINTDNELNNSWSSFLEARLIGLYGGRATSLLINHQHLISCRRPEKKLETGFLAGEICAICGEIISISDCTDFKPTKGCNDFKRKDKVNLFQSNLGIQEIKTATSLATTIVNNWVFSGLSSTKSIKNQYRKRYTFSPVQHLQQKVANVAQENTKTKLHSQFIKNSKSDNRPLQQIQSSVEGVYYTKSMESIGTKFIDEFPLGEFSDNVVFDSLCQWRGKWEEVVNYLEITLKSSLTPMTYFSKRVDLSPFLCCATPLLALGAQPCSALRAAKQEVGLKSVVKSVQSVQPKVVQIAQISPQITPQNSALGDRDKQEETKKKPKVISFRKSATSFFCLLNCVDYSITLFNKVDAHSLKSYISRATQSNSLFKRQSQITAIETVNHQAPNKRISYSLFVYICQSYLQSKGFVSKYSEELYYSSLQNEKPLRSLQLYARYLEEKRSKLTTNYQNQRTNPLLYNIPLDERPSIPFITNKNRQLQKKWNTFHSSDALSLQSAQIVQQPTLQQEIAQVVQNETKSKKGIKQFNSIRHCYNRGLLHDKFINLTNNKENQLDTRLFFSLEKQLFPSNYNDVAIVEKELIYHSLISNCFSKAFFLINQNRQLTDYFADYLIRFQVLRQHQILYIFSTVLFSCKKQT